jgi:hypothetical protein
LDPSGDLYRIVVLIRLDYVVVSVDNEGNSVITAGIIERPFKLAIPVQLGRIPWYAFVAAVGSNLPPIDKPFDVEHTSAFTPSVLNAGIKVGFLAGRHGIEQDLRGR